MALVDHSKLLLLIELEKVLAQVDHGKSLQLAMTVFVDRT
jgi:hypothetical protein